MWAVDVQRSRRLERWRWHTCRWLLSPCRLSVTSAASTELLQVVLAAPEKTATRSQRFQRLVRSYYPLSVEFSGTTCRSSPAENVLQQYQTASIINLLSYVFPYIRAESTTEWVKKVIPLRLLHMFLFAAILCWQKITQLFVIYVITYVPHLVHWYQYLWELEHFLVKLTREFFNDFCSFWSMAVNTIDKLQFLSFQNNPRKYVHVFLANSSKKLSCCVQAYIGLYFRVV